MVVAQRRLAIMCNTARLVECNKGKGKSKYRPKNTSTCTVCPLFSPPVGKGSQGEPCKWVWGKRVCKLLRVHLVELHSMLKKFL